LRNCRICKKEAIVYINYANISLCSEHFIEFYERKIFKILKQLDLRNKCILVALSGGKDSVALLFALYKLQAIFNYKLKVLHIDLGIGDYSKRSLEVSAKLTEKLNIPLIVFDLKKEFGWSIHDAVKIIRKPACSICGLVKRWVMNKVAIENECDYVATGHNIDDVNTFVLKAMLTYRPEDIIRLPRPILKPNLEVKLAGRIRPQFYATERENLLYTLVNGLDTVSIECPLARDAKSKKYRQIWEEIDKVNPVGKINFVNTIIKIIDKLDTGEMSDIKLCKICGYPTYSRDICTFCSMRMRIDSKLKNEES